MTHPTQGLAHDLSIGTLASRRPSWGPLGDLQVKHHQGCWQGHTRGLRRAVSSRDGLAISSCSTCGRARLTQPFSGSQHTPVSRCLPNSSRARLRQVMTFPCTPACPCQPQLANRPACRPLLSSLSWSSSSSSPGMNSGWCTETRLPPRPLSEPRAHSSLQQLCHPHLEHTRTHLLLGVLPLHGVAGAL